MNLAFSFVLSLGFYSPLLPIGEGSREEAYKRSRLWEYFFFFFFCLAIWKPYSGTLEMLFGCQMTMNFTDCSNITTVLFHSGGHFFIPLLKSSFVPMCIWVFWVYHSRKNTHRITKNKHKENLNSDLEIHTVILPGNCLKFSKLPFLHL